ncbi:hypothetical protein AQUCO_03400001v1 [Aquilegia coerulea]|uniref:F-box domain-containing protein n=1 Tax=Aquilegia coerulea TaxID=218851 RepID=A0A2G5CFG7_AQUCA|nr:hypothetical protein AQUCO_05800226v1 [Aquilegia coerulea]PIA35804.1 hypothetical protein AQUCO_03400001v1 [Aquilegia coerulea]
MEKGNRLNKLSLPLLRVCDNKIQKRKSSSPPCVCDGMERDRMKMSKRNCYICAFETDRMRNWSTLPSHLLDLIAECLDLPDLLRFGFVCQTWKSVCGPLQFRNHLPWLIVPIKNAASNTMTFDDKDNVGFFSLCDDKIYKAEIPELSNRRICASLPGGWLMTVHENSEIQLFHPFSPKLSLIHLPPLMELPCVLGTIKKEGVASPLYYIITKFGSPEPRFFPPAYVRDHCIHKVAMSSSLITSDTIIMIIQDAGHSMAFYRFGGNQEKWVPATQNQNHYNFQDITYHSGKFYAVHSNGYVIAIQGLDDTETLPYGEQVISQHPGDLAPRYYILESSGDLLVVLRYSVNLGEKDPNDMLQVRPFKTVGFKVFKIEFGVPDNKWVQIHNLGDRSLFLGYNSSFSLSSTHFSGCKPNHVYFTDDLGHCCYSEGHGGHDLGIFNLEDGGIETFLYPSNTLLVTPPPIWFAPNIVS